MTEVSCRVRRRRWYDRGRAGLPRRAQLTDDVIGLGERGADVVCPWFAARRVWRN